MLHEILNLNLFLCQLYLFCIIFSLIYRCIPSKFAVDALRDVALDSFCFQSCLLFQLSTCCYAVTELHDLSTMSNFGKWTSCR
jgi:hypothetical protein